MGHAAASFSSCRASPQSTLAPTRSACASSRPRPPRTAPKASSRSCPSRGPASPGATWPRCALRCASAPRSSSRGASRPPRSGRRAQRCASSGSEMDTLEGRRLPRHRDERRARGEERRRRSSSARGARRASSSRPSRASRRRASSSSRSRGASPRRASARCSSTWAAARPSSRSSSTARPAFTMSLPARHRAHARGVPQGRQDGRPRARAPARGGHRPRARRGPAAAREGRRRRRHGRQRRHALRPLPGQGTPRGIDVAAAKSLFKKLCAMSNSERRDAYQLRPDRADTHRPRDGDLPAPRQEARAQRTILAPGVGPRGGHPRGARRQVLPRLGRRGRGRARPRGVRAPRPALPLRRGPRAARRVASRRSSSTTCSGVHAFGERDRLLLRAAAMLHDIGDYIHYSGPPQAQPLPDPARRHHGHHARRSAPSWRTSRATTARARPTRATPATASSRRRRAARCAASRRSCASPTRSTASTSRRSRACAPPSTAARARVTLFLRGAGDRELEEWAVGAQGLAVARRVRPRRRDREGRGAVPRGA